ncbi:MAG TPA: hypothetical protein VGI40_16830 [Pirellulaceae bacterium]
MMSVAPLGDVSGPSLADYLAQEHAMGPIGPAEVATATADQSAAAELASANPLLLRSLAQGEGDDGTCTDETCTDDSGDDGTGTDGTGTDGTGTDGTGTDGTGDDGTGDDGTGDHGTGDNGTGDNGTGDNGTGDNGTGTDGTGTDGTGDGTGTDGTGDTSGDPTLSDVQVDNTDSTIVVTGLVSDNMDLSGLTMTLDNAAGDVQVNDDGSFTVNISNPDGYMTFTITALDADGNTTTYTFDYAP